ncbi:ProQ/FINO family protein [Herminiimonas sp. CN]|uniref:ProQ/FINO family protein n=1 Tax=Herminiimonas sp. CN TaxID=1349818 RepID=UPI000556ECC1|nr:ProQ/FINO family protein [Herminiimonas sp. CN]
MNTPNTVPVTVTATAPSPIQHARALLKDLQERFVAFREYMPLAIGIDKQLIALMPDTNRKILRIALGIHTKSLRYMKVMEKATVRCDLDGNAADAITDEHRAHASEVLRERFKKDAEQRKAQRQAAEAQRAAAEAERRHSEKLGQLAAKFARGS